MLVLVSRGGLGKSELAIRTLPPENRIVFKGRTSAVAMHNTCAAEPTKMLLLDDVPSMFHDTATVAELLQLCETKEDKIITYHTATPYVDKKTFISNNRVLILTNSLTHKNPQVQALLTRGFVVRFEPDNEEIFQELQTWAKDKDILAYLKSISQYVKLNFRMYTQACDLKAANMDWKSYLRKEFLIDPEEDLVREIYKLPTAERNTQWVQRTGKSVSTLLRVMGRMLKEKRL